MLKFQEFVLRWGGESRVEPRHPGIQVTVHIFTGSDPGTGSDEAEPNQSVCGGGGLFAHDSTVRDNRVESFSTTETQHGDVAMATCTLSWPFGRKQDEQN